MKSTVLALAAALAMVAVAPRSKAQETNRMTVGVALPESATIDTVKNIAGAKGSKGMTNFLHDRAQHRNAELPPRGQARDQRF